MKPRRENLNNSRRGISVIVVLGLIALTMAMSYALMRVEYYTVNVQQNSNRQNLARQAALVGLSKAIRAMEQSVWTITGPSVTGSLNATDTYSVTYTAGDSSLSSSDWENPYRVTILSTGTSADPSNSSSRATHKLRAVMRLIPRQLGTGPSDLANIVKYAWFQTQNDTFTFQVPVQVQGNVRVQGTVTLGSDYQWTSAMSGDYLDDLDKMRHDGYPDDRPFTGSMDLSFNQNNSTVQNWLRSTVNVSTLNNTPSTSMSAQWVFPASVGTYKLYTGGPSYTVPTAPSMITG
ncbi:MAG TPA: hypothetical protein VGI75_12750, partial [Pirellulales bacterium]